MLGFGAVLAVVVHVVVAVLCHHVAVVDEGEQGVHVARDHPGVGVVKGLAGK